MLRFWVGGYTPSSAIFCNFDNEFACDKPHYPFELPEGWCWCKLEDIVSFGGGKTPSMSVKQYWENGTNLWITSKDMKKERINDSLMKITDAALEGMNIYEKGTILVVTRSGILKHALPLAILGKKATVNQDLKTLSPYMLSLSEYLYFAIKANEKEILANYHKDGTTVDSIDFDKFRCLPIALPPMYEQKGIVKCIKHWFSLIESIEENRDKLQEVIKQTKSKILDLAIHGKLIPQDPSDESASELLKRINPKAKITCDNPQYGKLPNGWCEVQLGDVFNHNTGKALNASNTEGSMKRYLTTSNVYWNTFDFTTVKQMYYKDSELDKCSITKGDLLVCEGGDVGRAAIWNFNYDICIQNHLHRLRPKLGDLCVSLYYYVFYYLKVNNMIGGKGIGLLGLSSNALHRLHVPLPPINEQHRIVAKIEELFVQLDNITSSI